MLTVQDILQELLERYPQLAPMRQDIQQAEEILTACYRQGGTVFACGNGGSAADADHIVGELLKGFCSKRPLPEAEKAFLRQDAETAFLADRLQCGLRAINLMAQSAILTAVANDLDPEAGPAQILNGLARPGDVLIGISTSGNARNVQLACRVARLRKTKIIGLTGMGGGKLAKNADVCLKAPETETFKVQELHLPIYHALCRMTEVVFFPEA